MRLRKEAESAADLLGKGFQIRLKELYERLGINIPKKYSSLKETPRDDSKDDSEEE